MIPGIRWSRHEHTPTLPKGSAGLAGEILFTLESARAAQGEIGYSPHSYSVSRATWRRRPA